jgi:hypothetical protein
MLSSIPVSRSVVQEILSPGWVGIIDTVPLPSGAFRARLMVVGLWEVLLGEVNRQLEAKHIIMTGRSHQYHRYHSG